MNDGEVLRATAYEAGLLVRVEEVHSEGLECWVSAIALHFEHRSLAISVDDYTDEVRLTTTIPSAEPRVDVSSSIPWTNALGRGLRWAWHLTNQQGYDDGIQFEFANPDDRSTVVVQLIAAASRLQLFVVSELKMGTDRI